MKARAEQVKAEEGTSVKKGPAGRSQAGDLISAVAKSAAHAIGSQIGRQIMRGVLRSIFGGGRRG